MLNYCLMYRDAECWADGSGTAEMVQPWSNGTAMDVVLITYDMVGFSQALIEVQEVFRHNLEERRLGYSHELVGPLAGIINSHSQALDI